MVPAAEDFPFPGVMEGKDKVAQQMGDAVRRWKYTTRAPLLFIFGGFDVTSK
jgi:hypothetical protein